jgi:hypothetical protein
MEKDLEVKEQIRPEASYAKENNQKEQKMKENGTTTLYLKTYLPQMKTMATKVRETAFAEYLSYAFQSYYFYRIKLQLKL